MTLQSLRAAIVAGGFWIVFAGCSASPPPPAPPLAAAEIKTLLQDMAAAGRPSSALATVGPFLEKLKVNDPTNATSLQEDYVKLQKTQNPAEIKEIAGRMASKL